MLRIVGHRYIFSGHPFKFIDADQVPVQVFLGCVRRVRDNPGNRLFILARTTNKGFEAQWNEKPC